MKIVHPCLCLYLTVNKIASNNWNKNASGVWPLWSLLHSRTQSHSTFLQRTIGQRKEVLDLRDLFLLHKQCYCSHLHEGCAARSIHSNRPFPCCLKLPFQSEALKPPFQSEAKCEAIDMKMILLLYSHANKPKIPSLPRLHNVSNGPSLRNSEMACFRLKLHI